LSGSADVPSVVSVVELWRERFLDRLYSPGSRSTQGPRSHLPWLSLEAKNERIVKVWKAYRLRTQDGMSQAEIAEAMGVSSGWVGKWLEGVPRQLHR
jgi:hypothetical protein